MAIVTNAKDAVVRVIYLSTITFKMEFALNVAVKVLL